MKLLEEENFEFGTVAAVYTVVYKYYFTQRIHNKHYFTQRIHNMLLHTQLRNYGFTHHPCPMHIRSDTDQVITGLT